MRVGSRVVAMLKTQRLRRSYRAATPKALVLIFEDDYPKGQGGSIAVRVPRRLIPELRRILDEVDV